MSYNIFVYYFVNLTIFKVSDVLNQIFGLLDREFVCLNNLVYNRVRCLLEVDFLKESAFVLKVIFYPPLLVPHSSTQLPLIQ